MNNISRKKPIRVGKILKVPIGNYKAPPKKVYHTVKGGETLSGISVRFRTSVKKICRNCASNNQKLWRNAINKRWKICYS